MTTPDDLTPDDSTPVPKKPAAKKAVAPVKAAATPKTTAAKPKAAASKPAPKKIVPVDSVTTAALPATQMPTPATVVMPSAAKPAAKTPSKAGAPSTSNSATTKAPNEPVARKATAPKTLSTTKTATHEPELDASTPVAAAPVVTAASATSPEPAPVRAADWATIRAAKILKRAAKNTVKDDFVAQLQEKATLYWRLTRMDRPIGTLLLLWPTLWSLWIAAKGVPSIKNLVIFVLGVIVMRAAGCVINDFADRKIDGKVQRTKNRPLATGAVSSREAIGLFVALCLVAFALVLFTDPLTIKLSVGGLILAFCYPFMKRHTHLPQVVLGAAFAWGIPMAYAAEAGELHQGMWLIYLAVVLWTVAYDTFYAMVDRDDDVKIGVKSTAILFGEHDRLMTGVLQVMCLYSLLLVGNRFELGTFYYLGLVAAAGLFAYQQWLIRFRAREACFKAFLNNNWVGVAVFAGIVMDYSFR